MAATTLRLPEDQGSRGGGIMRRRLTKRERAATRAALAAYLAGDHDESEFDSYDLDDASAALEKLQER